MAVKYDYDYNWEMCIRDRKIAEQKQKIEEQANIIKTQEGKIAALENERESHAKQVDVYKRQEHNCVSKKYWVFAHTYNL